MNYAVNVRRREIGLRMAPATVRSQIVKQFLGQGMRVAVAGCAVRLRCTTGFGRVLRGMLFGVEPTDAATLMGVLGIVLVVAWIRAITPAERASRVEPMEVLGDE